MNHDQTTAQQVDPQFAQLIAFMKGSLSPRIMQAGSRWMCWSKRLQEWHVYDGRMPDGNGVLVWHTHDFGEALSKLNLAANLPPTEAIHP